MAVNRTAKSSVSDRGGEQRINCDGRSLVGDASVFLPLMKQSSQRTICRRQMWPWCTQSQRCRFAPTHRRLEAASSRSSAYENSRDRAVPQRNSLV